jgi:hypothetical protein
MTVSSGSKQGIHPILQMGMGGILVMSFFIDFRSIGYGAFKTVVCTFAVSCNSELPEIGANASNSRYLGKLVKDYGQIRYRGEEIGTDHRVETRTCKVPDDIGDGRRRYICPPKHSGGATFDITYRDAVPGLLQVTVLSHGNSRLEEMRFRA